MDNYGAGGIGASIIAVLGLIYTAINHKKVRSKCCGREVSASIDIEPSSPEKKQDKEKDDIQSNQH
jgi:hypothetical protein